MTAVDVAARRRHARLPRLLAGDARRRRPRLWTRPPDDHWSRDRWITWPMAVALLALLALLAVACGGAGG